MIFAYNDEPSRRLVITTPQAVNQEKLHILVNVSTPGLERSYRKENTICPSHQHALFVNENDPKTATANAIEQLDGLNLKLFDCPGQLFVKFD